MIRPDDDKSTVSTDDSPNRTTPMMTSSPLMFESDSINQTSPQDLFPEIIGRSPVMMKVLDMVARVARTDSAVFIFGESGTGKELIASAIHRLSGRSSRRFVALNCAAIPEELLESELFGHEKGAFTGAERKRLGYFAQANGGTIFLDEIGDMPMRLQAKLLRVLQERRFTPLGGTESVQADVRIIAATNVDLEKAKDAGRFRADLYYRLHVLPIVMPPLRQRSSDVRLLLEHFINQANQVHAPQFPARFSEEVLKYLENWPWPGNVRELQNLVERLVVTGTGGAIGVTHLPDEYKRQLTTDTVALAEPTSGLMSRSGATAAPVRRGAELGETIDAVFAAGIPSEGESKSTWGGSLPEVGIDLPRFIEDLENSLILQALERTGHNKNQAARLLGLNRTTLVERIKKRRIAPLKNASDEL